MEIDHTTSIIAQGGVEALATLPQGHFGTILADPPWAFKAWTGKLSTPHRRDKDHYPVMSRGDLMSLPVAQLAAQDCVLAMWVVDSHIDQAIELGKAWGFTLKTRVFTWIKTDSRGKPIISMGYWSRKQSEMVLLFTRGKPPRLSGGVRELIFAPRREHSRKPDDIYERLEQLVSGPYLELFARRVWPGWAAWGNQVGRFEETPLHAYGQSDNPHQPSLLTAMTEGESREGRAP